MSHSEGQFAGAGGLRIHWQQWAPRAPKAQVVIAHGLGEHGGRYRHVAAALNEAGFAATAIDHRGHGKSEGPRAYVDRFANAVEDMNALVSLVSGKGRSRPVFLLGHSMGGALSLSYALKHGERLAGLALSGPAIALDGAPPLVGPISKVLSAFAPKLGTFPIDPALVSRDPQMVQAYRDDPLNAHGKVPARTLGEIVRFTEWLPAALSALRLPVLIQHGTADKLAGIAGSRMVLSRLSSTDKTLKQYEGLYHEIFNELPEDREQVIGDLVDWIASRAH